MIDNPNQTTRLIAKLDAALPIAAAMSPECLALFRKETGVDRLSPQCMVSQIRYAGDEGGIVCGLAAGHDIGERVLFVSITHLRFDPRSPLARDIFSYQEHRAKRLRRTGEAESIAPAEGLHGLPGQA
jgi:hypothetical protein